MVEKKSYLKYYLVFNIASVDGIDFNIPKVEEKTEQEKIFSCEEILQGMPKKPTVTFGNSGAYYSPTFDIVNMPEMQTFTSEQAYYSVFFHELVHSTGHTSRLNRKEITETMRFGSQTYSKEELTAEIGASFLCAEAGILMNTFYNSVAYIQSWLKVLKDDKKFIIEAAAKAQKASDFILDKSFIEEV